jgi:hypothetical protein
LDSIDGEIAHKNETFEPPITVAVIKKRESEFAIIAPSLATQQGDCSLACRQHTDSIETIKAGPSTTSTGITALAGARPGFCTVTVNK